MLGDYIDRGADTRLTLDVLLARSRRHPSVYLKGNHEEVLLGFLRDPTRLQDWRQFGGLQTLISYGLNPSLHPDAGEQLELARHFAAALPPEHRRLLEGLKPSYACGDYFFCHAGVRPGVALEKQREEDLLWIRDEFLNSEADFGKFIIHGHTPVREPDLRANRLNIDTGAYAARAANWARASRGSLIAAIEYAELQRARVFDALQKANRTISRQESEIIELRSQVRVAQARAR
jgi:serine/threonine protein phosphatase 1